MSAAPRRAPDFSGPATDKQRELIRRLRDERVLSAEQTAWLSDERIERGLTIQTASQVIAGLFKLPQCQNGETLPEVGAGRYAVELEGELKFYHVDRPVEGKWAGRTFVRVRASDQLWPVKDFASRLAVLQAIAADSVSAMERFGRELGLCAICGRSLTDDESRARGIGPICITKMRGY